MHHEGQCRAHRVHVRLLTEAGTEGGDSAAEEAGVEGHVHARDRDGGLAAPQLDRGGPAAGHRLGGFTNGGFGDRIQVARLLWRPRTRVAGAPQRLQRNNVAGHHVLAAADVVVDNLGMGTKGISAARVGALGWAGQRT